MRVMAIAREIKVGLFVLMGFLGASVVIFLIGDNRSAFDSKVPFRAFFDDVQGLKRGSTVRMGGVNIGTVARVRFPDDLEQRRIEVVLDVVEREARRIRVDSVVGIAPKGLLGDKMLTVTAGSPDQPPAQAGSLLEGDMPQDFTALLGRLDSMSVKAEGVLSNLEDASSALADQQLRADLQRSVGSLANVLGALETGGGYAARILRDEREADRISGVVERLDQTTARLDGLLAEATEVVDRVNRGPGLLHEVVYGESGAQSLAQIGTAAAELGETLRGVREGSGLAHGLLFGDRNGESLAGDVAAVSQDLRAMVSDLRQGKGSLGALLVDPSVYEDLKLLLGNVQRNQALRALVRYSIQRDDGVPQVEVVDPATAPAARDTSAETAGPVDVDATATPR